MLLHLGSTSLHASVKSIAVIALVSLCLITENLLLDRINDPQKIWSHRVGLREHKLEAAISQRKSILETKFVERKTKFFYEKLRQPT